MTYISGALPSRTVSPIQPHLQEESLTPLMQKIRDRDLVGLQQLIKDGAKVDADTLTYAVEVDARDDMIKVLCQANRDAVFDKDRNGDNALTIAARKNSPKSEHFLFNGTLAPCNSKMSAMPQINPHFGRHLVWRPRTASCGP